MLLMGMEFGEATRQVENSMEVPQIIKHRTAIGASDSLLGIHPKKLESGSLSHICIPYSPGQRSCRICTLPQGQGLPGGSEGKASAYNGGDLGSIPGSGRSPGEGNGNPLQYSCQEIPMDGGAW